MTLEFNLHLSRIGFEDAAERLSGEARANKVLEEWGINKVDWPAQAMNVFTGRVPWIVLDPADKELFATPGSPRSMMRKLTKKGLRGQLVMLSAEAGSNYVSVSSGNINDLFLVGPDSMRRILSIALGEEG